MNSTWAPGCANRRTLYYEPERGLVPIAGIFIRRLPLVLRRTSKAKYTNPQLSGLSYQVQIARIRNGRTETGN